MGDARKSLVYAFETLVKYYKNFLRKIGCCVMCLMYVRLHDTL